MKSDQQRQQSGAASSAESPEGSLLGRRKLLVWIGSAGLVGCGMDDRSSNGKTLRENLGIIDGGVAIDDTHGTLESALAAYASPSNPATIVIDRVLPVTASSPLAIPAHVTLRFQDGGQVKPTSNTVLQLRGRIEAPPNPPRPLFDVSSSGSRVVPLSSDTAYYANWWSTDAGGAGDIGQQWNNMVRGLSMLERKIVFRGPTEFRVAGDHDLRTMLDARHLDGHTLDFTGSTITVKQLANNAGGIAVNFTGSAALTIRGLTLICDDASAHIGVLFSRHRKKQPNNNIESSHLFRVFDLRILGSWQVAALYSIASESNIFWGGHWENVNPNGFFATYFCHHKPNPEWEEDLFGFHPFPDDVLIPTLVVPPDAPADWELMVLPYDGTTDQTLGLPCAETPVGFNPADSTMHGNELLGVTILSKVAQGAQSTDPPKGALYLKSTGVFSVHGARIYSDSAPYLVMHAVQYPFCGTHHPTNGPLRFPANDVGPLLVRNLLGLGINNANPRIALRTIGLECGDPVFGGGQGRITVDLMATSLETSSSADARELEIGRCFLAGRVSLPGLAGVSAVEGAMVGADIELRARYEVLADFALARQFFGRVSMGPLVRCGEAPAPLLTQLLVMPHGERPCSQDTVHQARGIVRSFYAPTQRARHYSPVSITQRTATTLHDHEAVLYVQQGQIKITIKHPVSGTSQQKCGTIG